jgi:hypothetical protein
LHRATGGRPRTVSWWHAQCRGEFSASGCRPFIFAVVAGRAPPDARTHLDLLLAEGPVARVSRDGAVYSNPSS